MGDFLLREDEFPFSGNEIGSIGNDKFAWDFSDRAIENEFPCGDGKIGFIRNDELTRWFSVGTRGGFLSQGIGG